MFMALFTVLVLAGCGSAPGDDTVLGAAQQPTTTNSAPAEVSLRMQESQAVTFTKKNDWGSGFTGEIQFTNTTGKAISDWQVQFRLPATISSVWNAKLLDASQEYKQLIPESYNRTLKPGETVKIGFNAAPGGSSVTATELSINWPDSDAGGEAVQAQVPEPSIPMSPTKSHRTGAPASEPTSK